MKTYRHKTQGHTVQAEPMSSWKWMGEHHYGRNAKGFRIIDEHGEVGWECAEYFNRRFEEVKSDENNVRSS
jgi:hypothetical protein